MKWFFILMALLVGGSIYVLANSDEIAKTMLADVEKLEGNPEAFETLKYREPATFALQQAPQLERRAAIAKWSNVLGGDDMLRSITFRSMELYGGSSLESHPAYEDLLWRCVRSLESQNSAVLGQYALNICRKYQEIFPEGLHKFEIAKSISDLNMKYTLK